MRGEKKIQQEMYGKRSQKCTSSSFYLYCKIHVSRHRSPFAQLRSKDTNHLWPCRLGSSLFWLHSSGSNLGNSLWKDNIRLGDIQNCIPDLCVWTLSLSDYFVNVVLENKDNAWNIRKIINSYKLDTCKRMLYLQMVMSAQRFRGICERCLRRHL